MDHGDQYDLLSVGGGEIMSKVVLIRIDSRLVHGQVCSSWIPSVGAKRVIIVNDEYAAQSFMHDIHQMAVPKGVKCDTFSVQQALEEWKANGYGDENVLILFKELQAVLKMYEGGFKYPELQLGTLSGGSGKKVLYGAISVADEDVDILKKLTNLGINVYIQQLANEPAVAVKSLLDRM